MDIPAELEFSLEVDGVDHPVSIDAVTARQIGELELFFSLTLERVVARLLAQELTPLETAGLLYLSARQAERPVDPDALLDSVRIGSTVAVTFTGKIPASIARDADPNS